MDGETWSNPPSRTTALLHAVSSWQSGTEGEKKKKKNPEPDSRSLPHILHYKHCLVLDRLLVHGSTVPLHGSRKKDARMDMADWRPRWLCRHGARSLALGKCPVRFVQLNVQFNPMASDGSRSRLSSCRCDDFFNRLNPNNREMIQSSLKKEPRCGQASS